MILDIFMLRNGAVIHRTLHALWDIRLHELIRRWFYAVISPSRGTENLVYQSKSVPALVLAGDAALTYWVPL